MKRRKQRGPGAAKSISKEPMPPGTLVVKNWSAPDFFSVYMVRKETISDITVQRVGWVYGRRESWKKLHFRLPTKADKSLILKSMEEYEAKLREIRELLSK